ncbi:Ubiquitin 3 binding protein But2 C-terminal domain-containing protein [Madurella fahalii]|uniref:Ubiquitin 3 binding protein But2 C-terminal domain-containing protein n=1 Tax=Madurella fahalii TaxID=1157608 RepID=A0ABQ0G0U6_9PEZI
MLSRLQIIAALVGMTYGLPNPSATDDPVRILPFSWRFDITALSGPGCPDFGQTVPPYVTRPTFGSNTVDGSEIYYWHFAYPHIRASVGPDTTEASTWCETTLSYAELDRSGAVVAEPEYRLKLHKNGTAVIASYDLEEGVEAKWKVTYYTDGESEIVDTLTIAGPRDAGSYHDISPTEKLVQWVQPKCGTATIKYRTELTVSAKKEGARGTVSSEEVQYEGKTEYYGVQQGVSYDWEKCAA